MYVSSWALRHDYIFILLAIQHYSVVDVYMSYYSLFQPLIDSSSIICFIKILCFGLNTKAIIRDNTRQNKIRMHAAKILAREFIR